MQFSMKKILISLALACGLASVPVFAQSVPPATGTIPAPACADNFVFTNSVGHTVPYSLLFASNGITYAVFDPSISAADYIAAFAFLQTPVGQVEANGAKVLPLVIPGFVNMNIGTQIYRTTSAVTIASTAVLQTIPGLQATVGTGNNYTFRAVLFTATGAGGIKIDFGGTAVPVNSSVQACATAFTNTGVAFSTPATGFLTGPAGASTAGITEVVIEGTFQVNTGGTFVIQFAQNGSNAAQTILEYGSTLTVTQVP
jgi:hypothetical protein